MFILLKSFGRQVCSGSVEGNRDRVVVAGAVVIKERAGGLLEAGAGRDDLLEL